MDERIIDETIQNVDCWRVDIWECQCPKCKKFIEVFGDDFKDNKDKLVCQYCDHEFIGIKRD